MADVKTPAGRIPKWAVWGAVIGGGGALVYAYVKKKNKKSAAGSPQSAYGYGAGAYGYGSAPYGYGAYTYDPYGYGYGPFGLGAYGGQGQYGYGYYNAGVQQPVQQQATTNAEWTQAVISALTPQGYTGQQILGAVSPYLAGQQVNQSQEQIIQAAIAVEGYPPVAGTNGFPPGIKTGGGTGNKVIVPDVKGIDQAQAFEVLKSEGFKPAGRKAIPGKVLIVTSTNPPAGASVNKGTTVHVSTKIGK